MLPLANENMVVDSVGFGSPCKGMLAYYASQNYNAEGEHIQGLAVKHEEPWHEHFGGSAVQRALLLVVEYQVAVAQVADAAVQQYRFFARSDHDVLHLKVQMCDVLRVHKFERVSQSFADELHLSLRALLVNEFEQRAISRKL